MGAMMSKVLRACPFHKGLQIINETEAWEVYEIDSFKLLGLFNAPKMKPGIRFFKIPLIYNGPLTTAETSVNYDTVTFEIRSFHYNQGKNKKETLVIAERQWNMLVQHESGPRSLTGR